MGEKLYLALYELSKLIINFMIVNVLWIIVNIPVLVLLIQLTLTTEVSNLLILLPLISLLLPVLFFPGLQALISSMRTLIREDSYIHLVSFYKGYKTGYKNSFIVGVVFTAILNAIGILVYLNREGLFIINTILLVILLYSSIVTYYSLFMEAHYNMSVVWVLKQAFYFIISFPFFAFTNFVMFTVLQYIIFTVSTILYILFGLALTVYLSYYLFLRKLNKNQDSKIEV